MDIQKWNDIISVDLTSAFLAAKAQIQARQQGRDGPIVFNSSFVG